MRNVLYALVSLSLVVASCGNGGGKKGASQPSTGTTATVADSTLNIIALPQGKIAGSESGGVYIYKGVPYAEAGRFEEPRDPRPWQGVRSCRAYGPTCPQPARTGWESDEQAFAFDWDDGHPGEDCLRLNVWTSTLKNKHLPVMVWIHGGGFQAGSGQELPSYDGTSLASSGEVVVVTLNHRLNVLGYLDLSAFGNKYASTGNLGMLDIVKALGWVKANINKFGGDPDNVTIFGQSGGGGKVSTLLAMPSAKGLFQKAIIESGSQLKAMDRKYSRRIGANVVRRLGLVLSTIDKIKDVPYERLMTAGNAAVAEERQKAEKEGWDGFIFGWSPVVDGTVLPQHPSSPNAPQISKDVPVIIGTTLNEFCRSAFDPSARGMTDNDAMAILRQQYGSNTDALIKAFAKVYPDMKPSDIMDVDLNFRQMAIDQARLKTRLKGAPVYMYLFAWQSPALNGIFKAVHCMEIPFVFNNTARQAGMTGNTPEARELARKMSVAWISFAKTGKPTAEGMPDWEAYSQEKGATMIFDNNCHMAYNHDSELIKLVKTLRVKE